MTLKIGELRIVLERLQRLYVVAGANGPAKDLKMFCDVLEGHVDRPVDVFVAELRGRLDSPAAKSTGRKRVSDTSKNAVSNEEAIRRHLENLGSASTNQDMFDEALDSLKADKSLRLLEVGEIARRYADSVVAYKSVATAYKDISKAFVRQARFANKLR